MDKEITDAPEVLETPEIAAETTPETPEPELTVEQIAELKAKAAKADELESKNKQLYERLKKQPPPPAPSQETVSEALSVKDQVFLAKADIHEDDLDEVLDRAKSKRISIQEAYKQVKPLLDARAEERKTATAANVRNVRQGASKVTDDVLLSNASAGKLPESDDEIARLVKAAALKNRG